MLWLLAQAACPPGSYSQLPSGCTFCPIGKFSGRVGSSSCHMCRPGRYSTTLLARTRCLPCAPGHFARDWGRATCHRCPHGHRQPLPGRAFCRSDALRYCRAGRFAAHTGSPQSACYACPAGKFGALSPINGLGGCFSCAQGRAAAQQGATVCEPCPPGFVSPLVGGARRACTPCAAGRHYVRRSGTELVVGDAEIVVSVGCTACAAGRFQSKRGQLACKRCKAARYAPEVAALRCRRATPHEVMWNSKVLCAAGRSGTTCARCPAGRYAPRAGLRACLRCAPCKAALQRGGCGGASAGACTACGAGQYEHSIACWSCSSGVRKICVPCAVCAPGAERLGCGGRKEGTCALCAAGRFKAAAAAGHTAAGAADADVARCKICPAGTGQLARGQLSCYPTPAPTPAPTEMEVPPPTPPPTPAPPPSPVPTPRASRLRQATHVPGNCPRGRYSTQGASTVLLLGRTFCMPCPRGKFGWRRAHTAVCNTCPFGKFSLPASTQCNVH